MLANMGPDGIPRMGGSPPDLPEDPPTGEMELDIGSLSVEELGDIENKIDIWVQEVRKEMPEEEPGLVEDLDGWDDVNNVGLPKIEVEAAMEEESKYMIGRQIWTNVPEEECWRVTGKPPIESRWVVTDKAFMSNGPRDVRARIVAKDYKGADKNREDLFAETPPLEAKRLLLLSRSVALGDRNCMMIYSHFPPSDALCSSCVCQARILRTNGRSFL